MRSLEERTAYQPFEILIVDNGSDDPETVEYLGRVSHRVLSFTEPFNFARMNNHAAAAVRGEHLRVPQRRHAGHRVRMAGGDA